MQLRQGARDAGGETVAGTCVRVPRADGVACVLEQRGPACADQPAADDGHGAGGIIVVVSVNRQHRFLPVFKHIDAALPV